MKIKPLLKKALRIFRSLSVLQLGFLVLLFSIVSVWQLRSNNLTMLALRDKVIEVDGNTGRVSEVEPHLIELGEYVLNHMNTRLAGPIELVGSYNAAVEIARREVEQSGTANGAVYKDAQAQCERQSIPLTARAQCIQDFVLQNAPPGTSAQELVFPEKSLYSYNFASPVWSPDFAGFSVLGFIMSVGYLGLKLLHWYARKKLN